MLDSNGRGNAVIRARIAESIAVKEALLSESEKIWSVAEALIAAYRRGGKALFFGNGGSATDAQHMAAEFVGRYYLDRPPLPALALTENAASLTAIGNDYSFEDIFARQMQALGTPGDVGIGLSTSGNSVNVVTGLAMAKQLGLVTVALTGSDGGRLASAPGIDYCLRVSSDDTPRVQEAHTFICHLWCEFVEQSMVSGMADVQSAHTIRQGRT